MKLLVHACCGPCSIMPTRLLAEQGHTFDVFYANSNIAPRAEYEHRLDELVKYAASQNFKVIEGAYEPARWEQEVAPLGEALRAQGQLSYYLGSRHVGDSETAATDDTVSSTLETSRPTSVSELLDDEHRKERCRACYRMRLEEAARFAAANGYDGMSTTLAVSPYQFTEVIHEELERATDQAGIAAVFEDFRPYYDEATRISRELGMYRQNYCGCRFSIAEGEATRAFIKEQRRKAKEAKRTAREQEDRSTAEERAAKKAYADKQARKRAILKQLREREVIHEDE